MVERFESVGAELLVAVKKTEESLNKLKKTRKKTAVIGMSDDDKIRLQVRSPYSNLAPTNSILRWYALHWLSIPSDYIISFSKSFGLMSKRPVS